ncbi:MAG: hypothetical protein H6509_15885 [Bryobacterales bacterium]|nr:hypothetical protein [Bryobacterales bacterium]
MQENIRVLTVAADDALDALLDAPQADSFEVVAARNCAEARATFARRLEFDVVVSDLTLEDGNWWSIFEVLTNQNTGAEMVVVAPRRGLDVSEILAHGVFSVLGRPVTSAELVEVIEEAARSTDDAGPPPIVMAAADGAWA